MYNRKKKEERLENGEREGTKVLFLAVKDLFCQLNECRLGLRIRQSAESRDGLLTMALGQHTRLGETLTLQNKTPSQFHIALLIKVALDQLAQLRVFLPREQDRGRCQSQLQVRTSWLSKLVRGDCEIQHIVYELSSIAASPMRNEREGFL